MTTVHIPATIEALTAGLGGLDLLLTAKQWERAAIVFAWTRDAKQGRTGTSTGLTCEGFAALGISGLRTDRGVRQYRDAWKSAGGDPDIQPGADVTLPDAVWEDHFQSDIRSKATAVIVEDYLVKNPEVAIAAVTANPVSAAKVFVEVAQDEDRVADILDDSPQVVLDNVQHGVFKARTGIGRPGVTPVTPMALKYPAPIDYNHILNTGVHQVIEALRAEADGKWKPNGFDLLGIYLLTEFINKREAQAVDDDLFDRLDKYLKGEVSTGA